MEQRRAWGYGVTTTVVSGDAAGQVLDTWFPEPALGQQPGNAGAPHELSALTGSQEYAADRGVRLEVAVCAINLDEPPADAVDAYLRLHLLSHRLVAPRTVNLDGLFGVLPYVLWRCVGACPVDVFERFRIAVRRMGPVLVLGVEKFPRM
jgi:2,3,4,5-tetrahydropyridine-2-carboxylate N-succinyltransferase